MSDKSDPDFDDIDAYLSGDGFPGPRGDSIEDARDRAQDNHRSDPNTRSSKRLLARAAHAIADLTETGSAQVLNAEFLAMDQQLRCEISTELDVWNAAVETLEELLDDNKKIFALRQRPAERRPAANKRAIGSAKLPGAYARSGNDATTDARLPCQTINARNQTAEGPFPLVNRIIIAVTGRGNLKFQLDKAIVTIGRKADNDIPIKSRFISRYHARIISDRDGAIIEDIESRNGVSVNSERVHRRQLRSGDLIDIGRTQLKFIDLSEDSAGEGNA